MLRTIYFNFETIPATERRLEIEQKRMDINEFNETVLQRRGQNRWMCFPYWQIN